MLEYLNVENDMHLAHMSCITRERCKLTALCCIIIEICKLRLALLWSCRCTKLGARESAAQPSYRLVTYTASSRRTGPILRPCVFIVACLTSTPRGAKVSYSDKKEAWRWHRTSVVGLARHKKKHIQLHFQEKALWEHDEHSEDDIKG